jgi:hypothetical protein
MKKYKVISTCETVYESFVMANSEEEAKEKFLEGEYTQDTDEKPKKINNEEIYEIIES